MKIGRLFITFIIIILETSLCLSQTLPEMIYDLEHSDIMLIEVNKDIAIMYGGVGKLERKN